MDADQILAFRLARSGLAERYGCSLAEAAACPASDFHRAAALLALAARTDDISRERYDAAVDAGHLVVAHVVRGAIHALAPDDLALYGRALVAHDDAELAEQLGRQVKRLAAEHGFATTAALDEVAAGRGCCATTRARSSRRRRRRASASCRPATRTSRSPTAPCSRPTTRCASGSSGRSGARAR